MNCYKAARKAAKMTQAELSARIHVSQGSISQWETGATNPDIRTLAALADTYGISIDELLGHDIVPTSEQYQPGSDITADELSLIENYRQLNQQGKEYVRQTMYMAVSSAIYKNRGDVPGMADVAP